MSRLGLSCLGALIAGAWFWAVFGAIAAAIFHKMPGGAREGAGAMAGMFFVGSICGVIGLGLGGWLTWRMLANPERTGAVSTGLVVLAAVLIVGVAVSLRPTIADPDDYPGQRAALEVEVGFPRSRMAQLNPRDRLEFELRSGDGTETTTPDRRQTRTEGGGAIVPGAFSIRARPRTKLLAVMVNDSQWVCSTLTVEGPLDASTAWSEWQPMEDGFQARWRLMLTPK